VTLKRGVFAGAGESIKVCRKRSESEAWVVYEAAGVAEGSRDIRVKVDEYLEGAYFVP
jgi:hypothetical protein